MEHAELINLINDNKWDVALNLIEANNTIDKYILDGNSIVHLSIIRGNYDFFKKIVEKTENIMLANKDGYSILHLAFKSGYDEIGIKLINEYPSLVDLLNQDGETFLFNCIDRPETLLNALKAIDKNKVKKIINRISINYDTILKLIIKKLSQTSNDDKYIDILKYILDNGADLTKPVEMLPLSYAITKKSNDAVKILIDYGADVNLKDTTHRTPVIYAIYVGNLDALEYLSKTKNELNLEYGGFENDTLPINLLINGRYFHILEIAMKKIKDFNVRDRYMDSYLHKLLYIRIDDEKKEIEKTISDDILKYFIERTRLEAKNIEGVSVLNLLTQLKDWDNFEKYLEDRDIETNINDIGDIIGSFDDDKYVKLIDNKLKLGKPIKLKIDKPTNIIPNVESSLTGLFNSDTIHSILYICHFLNKYDELTIPLRRKDNESYKSDIDKLYIQNIRYDKYYEIVYSIVDTLNIYFYEILPHIILWRNKYIYFIHSEFNKYLKKSYKYTKRFVLVKLSLIASLSTSHANVLLIDKKTKTARRFEPYGFTDIVDGISLDNMLEKIINESIEDKIKYLRPDDYLSSAKFQTISNDTNDTSRKLGDPVGYCLAWCLWYVDLKLKNPDVDENELIQSTIDEIFNKYKNDDNPFLSYIRAYAKTLDSEKNKLLRKFNIEDKHIYSMEYKNDNIKKITNGISEFISKKLTKK